MKLFKIEILKLKANYTLHGFFLVYVIMIPLVFTLIGYFDLSSYIPDKDIKDIYRFPYNWDFLPYLASWFNIILGISVISFVASEFSANMYRKTFIDGLTREELYLGKLIMVVVLSTFCVVYLFLLIGCFGIIYSDITQVEHFFNFKPLLLYFFQSVCYFSFALFLVTWVKNSSTSILLFIGYFFLEWLISIPLAKSFEIFLPFEAFSEIVPMPYSDMISANIQQGGLPIESNKGLAPYVSVLYLVLMQGITYLLIKLRSL